MPLKHKLVITKILYPALTCSHRSALLGGPPMTQKFPQKRRHLIKGRRKNVNTVQIETSLGDRYDQAVRGPPAPPLNLRDPVKH